MNGWIMAFSPKTKNVKFKIMPSVQFNDEDNKAVSGFLGLLVNLGMTPTQAYETVDKVLLKVGYEFMCFNDIEDFWITDYERK